MNTKIHLCNSCNNDYPTCGGVEIDFGDGLGNDNIIKCSGYIPTKSIKDSGDRTEFATGAVRDLHQGKGRYDLLPWDAIHELALHCEAGALKYGERNCEKGIPIHSLIDSATRHLSCYLRGMNDEPHLRAAMWNIAFAIHMEKHHPELQDIPVRMEGFHFEGIGWSPKGEWCGECGNSTCMGCKVAMSELSGGLLKNEKYQKPKTKFIR